MTKQEFDIAMAELAMQRDEVLARNLFRIYQIKNEQTRLTDEHFKKMRELDEMKRKIDGENRTARNMFNQQKLELMRQMETGVDTTTLGRWSNEEMLRQLQEHGSRRYKARGAPILQRTPAARQLQRGLRPLQVNNTSPEIATSLSRRDGHLGWCHG